MLSRALAARRRMIRSIAVLWIVVLAGAALTAQKEPFKPFKLRTLDGKEKALADVLGPKATLVVFFFPTCRFCNEAFPAMQRLYDAHSARGFSMVWINAVPREERLIAAWREKHGYTVPVLVGASIRTIDKDYGITMTPTLFLLDAQGRIVMTHAGYRAGDEKVIEQAILLALD